MKDPHQHLSRRERQIMDILFAAGEAAICEQLPDPPDPAAVRTMLRILDQKGMVRRRKQGREHLYRPRPARHRAGLSALERVRGRCSWP